MSNLTVRIITSAIGIPIIILAVLKGDFWIWKSIILVATILALYEFYKMVESRFPDFNDIKLIGIPVGGLVAATALFYPQYLYVTPTFAFIILALYFMLNFKDIETVAQRMGYTVIAILYISFLMPYVAILLHLNQGRYLVFLLLAITWGNDTFAYAFGRLFHGKIFKRKLYESLSPNKSIEGAIGGVVGGVGLAIAAKFLILSSIPLGDIILVALIMGPMGQSGDLIESMFKRYFKVKDSGNMIPGHGGILDRLDAVIINAPILFFYLQFTKGGLF